MKLPPKLATVAELYGTAAMIDTPEFWLRELCVQLRVQNELLAAESETLQEIRDAIQGVDEEVENLGTLIRERIQPPAPDATGMRWRRSPGT